MSTLEWSSFDEYIKKESELANACLSLLVEFQNFSLRPLQKRFELIEVDGENDS
jgi:hypothetical protein